MSHTEAITIGSRRIGPQEPPFIIAEMSGNHNQSFDKAIAIVEAAAQAGADALKLQTYTADTMTLDISDGDFFIKSSQSLWEGNSLHSLYQKAYTPWEWHQPIMERCQQLGLICFSSPFDFTAVDFLETLQVPAYKIASFEIVDLPLIQKVAATGKPVIISTGMASESEIEEAVHAARQAGCTKLILLKCTSSYPANPAESHLNTIPYLRDRFGVQVGLSDHTPGIGAAVASVALGATVIEKHFTIDRSEGGVDAAFSLEPAELSHLVKESRIAHQALGGVFLGVSEHERPSLQFRRSLYIAADMSAGEEFTPQNLRSIRPGFGLPPKYLNAILGKHSAHDLKKGTALRWEHVADVDKFAIEAQLDAQIETQTHASRTNTVNRQEISPAN